MDMQNIDEAQNLVELKQKPKSTKSKILIIIGSVLLFLLLSGFALWYFIFNTISLVQYDNSGYSITIPQSYVKSESSTGEIEFYKSDLKDKKNRSYVSIGFKDVENVFRSRYIDYLDKTTSRDFIEKYRSSDSLVKTNVVVDKTKKGDIDVWTISGDLPDSGKFRSVILLGKDKIYFIKVLCRNDEPKLIDSAIKITDSFVIK